MSRVRSWIPTAAVLGVGIAFQAALVHTWHVPAGDGQQYYALSQELARSGRFAFGPPPAPLSYTRMPGYPLFLSFVAVRQARLPLEQHLRRATRANVMLSAATAVLVMLVLRRRWGVGAGLFGLAATLFSPLLLRVAGYGLSETLATFLSTAELFLALAMARTLGKGGRALGWAALSGLVAGMAQLVRADAITFAPAVGLALLWARAPARRRLQAAAMCALGAALVFAPWPARNLLRFGQPHSGAVYIRTQTGAPIPDALFDWERTWASGAPGESYLELVLVIGTTVDTNRPGIIQSTMYDSEEERQRLVALFQRYVREGWSREVVCGFQQLARERMRHHSLRTFVVLPLKRILHLWSPVPEWELPLRVSWLGLPQQRVWFDVVDGALLALALVGAAGMWRAGRGTAMRRLAALLLTCLATRTALFGYAVPTVITPRYLVEGVPYLIILAGYAAAVILPQQVRRLRLRQAHGTSTQEAGSA